MDQKSSTTADQSSAADDDGNEQKQAEDQASVACPRCHSFNTKFCYFNNYNVKQPRHFCRECQRYWTAGGSLRNVPVGAGRRRNKGSSPSIVSNEAVAIAAPYQCSEPGRLFNNGSSSGSNHGSSGHEGMAVSAASSSSSSASLPPLSVDPCASAILSFKQPAMAPNLSETAQRSFALLHNLSETQRNFSVLAQKHPSELTPQNIAVLQKIHAELTQHNLAAALHKSIASEAAYEAALHKSIASETALQKAFRPETATETLHRNRPETLRKSPSSETQHQRTPFLQQKHTSDMQQQQHQSSLFLQQRDCSHSGDVRVSRSFSSTTTTTTTETLEKKPDRNVSLDLKLCKDNGKEKMDERLPPSTSFAEDKQAMHHHHPHPHQLPAPFAKQDLLSSLPNADHDESTCCSSVTAALACSSSGPVSHPATTVAVPPSSILPPAGFVNPSPLMFHPWLWPFILNSTGALLAAGIPRIDPSFAAAISAMALAQSDPTLAARIAAMASLSGAMPCLGGPMPSTGAMACNGGPIPSLNGAMASLNGVIASLNGAMPSLNGAMPSLNGAMPCNGVMASANGAMPSNGVMASVNGAMPSNGVMASVNGAMPSSPQAYQSSMVSSNPALVTFDTSIHQPSNQASVGFNCVPQAALALNTSVPQQHHGQASMVQNGAPPAASTAPHVDPALMARIAALASGSMSPIDPSLTAALAAGYLQWQQQAWNPYAWMFPWNLQWNASNPSVNANTNINTNTNIASASMADGTSAVSKRPRSPPANEEQISALQNHKLSKTEIEAEVEADNRKRNHDNGLSLASPHTLSSVGASGSFNLHQSNGDLAQKTMVLHHGLGESDQQSKPCNQAQSVVSQEGT